MPKILITLSNPRSGTVFLFHKLQKMFGQSGKAQVYHEVLTQREAKLRWLFRCYSNRSQEAALNDPKIGNFYEEIIRKKAIAPAIILGNSLSHLAPIFATRNPENLVFLRVRRDPLITAASTFVQQQPSWWKNVPAFENDYFGSRITPTDPNSIFPNIPAKWGQLSIYQRVFYNHLSRAASHAEIIQKYPQIPSIDVEFEEAVKGQATLDQVSGALGLPSVDFETIEVPRNQTWRRSIEEHPLTLDEAQAVFEWPDYQNYMEKTHSKPNWTDSANQLQKYLLPKSTMSQLRHRTRYWTTRRHVASVLRRSGILAKQETRLGDRKGD